jgi:hypothetical protein
MRVGILTCSTPNRKWLYDITNRTKERYCVAHNMDYIFSDDFYPDSSRHPYWNKIKYIYDYLHKYDWVLWMDDDAGFISNESIEPIFNTDKEFLYATDMNGFNAGVMGIKNTIKMRGSFGFIWFKMYETFKTHQFPEQDAIKRLILDELKLGQFIDGKKYNAYDRSLTECDINQADANTIILHIAGGSWFKETHQKEIKELYETYLQ